MLIHYVAAVQEALMTLWGWVTGGFGISVLLVVAALGLGLAYLLKREEDWLKIDVRHYLSLWRIGARWSSGWVGVLVVATVGWHGLGAVYKVAQIDENWREGASAVTNPLSVGAPIVQSGPALTAIGERSYRRTLRLPSTFLNQLGEDGLGVLAPYVKDPTAKNVLRLRDRFRRSGREVVFTRDSTVRAEIPLSFEEATVKVAFVPLGGRVYDGAFVARYAWSNEEKIARVVRFTFSLPAVGTLRDLKVLVDGVAVPQAEDSQSYQWQQVMRPGDSHSATVTYRAVGARAWNYNLGSQRRRVQQFALAATGLPAPRFGRGGLLPTSRGTTMAWNLDNVVTEQQIALVWPEDYGVRLYLQAVKALTLSLIGFLPFVLALGLYGRSVPHPMRILVALAIFVVALAAATVVTIYTGASVGLVVAPLIGAIVATLILGQRFGAVLIPLALLPATLLSEQHTGLMLVGLFIFALATTSYFARRDKTQTLTDPALD